MINLACLYDIVQGQGLPVHNSINYYCSVSSNKIHFAMNKYRIFVSFYFHVMLLFRQCWLLLLYVNSVRTALFSMKCMCMNFTNCLHFNGQQTITFASTSLRYSLHEYVMSCLYKIACVNKIINLVSLTTEKFRSRFRYTFQYVSCTSCQMLKFFYFDFPINYFLSK